MYLGHFKLTSSIVTGRIKPSQKKKKKKVANMQRVMRNEISDYRKKSNTSGWILKKDP